MARKKKEPEFDDAFEQVREEFHKLEQWWKEYTEANKKQKEEVKKSDQTLRKMTKEEEENFYNNILSQPQPKKRGRKRKV